MADSTATPPGPPDAPRATGLVFLLLAVVPLSMIGSASLLAGALVTQLALLLVTLRWARRTGFDPARLLRLTAAPPRSLLLGAGIGVAGILAGGGLQSLTRAVLPRRLVETFDVGRLLMSSGWSQSAMIAVISLLPALCEELAFRGGLQSALAGRRSPARAIALSALLFALFHLDPVRFPGVLMLGVAFGWLTWRTGSIWPAMVAHAINNGTAVLGLLVAAGTSEADPSGPVTPGEAVTLLVAGLALYALLARATRRWLPPPPAAATFLVRPGAVQAEHGGGNDRPPPDPTTAGAAPSPSGSGLP